MTPLPQKQKQNHTEHFIDMFSEYSLIKFFHKVCVNNVYGTAKLLAMFPTSTQAYLTCQVNMTFSSYASVARFFKRFFLRAKEP